MKVELNKHNKKDIVLMLKTAQKLFNVDSDLYQKTETDKDEGLYVLDTKSITDQFYKRLIGMSSDAVSKYFATPTSDFNYCVAWYNKANSNKHNGALITPDERFYNYIPDCIENIIISKELKAEEKYEVIKKMMLDLKKLKAVHEYKKKLFNN